MYFGLHTPTIAGPANTARGAAADPFQRIVDSLSKPPQYPALRQWGDEEDPTVVLFTDKTTAICLSKGRSNVWYVGEVARAYPHGNLVTIEHEGWEKVSKLPAHLYSR